MNSPIDCPVMAFIFEYNLDFIKNFEEPKKGREFAQTFTKRKKTNKKKLRIILRFINDFDQ